MANSKVYAVLDIAVLKYLAKRGFNDAHAALKQSLRVDDGHAMASHFDLESIFYNHLTSHGKEVRASVHQLRAHAQNGQLSYDQLLMAGDFQGIGQGMVDGNDMKRMRASHGRIPIMTGLKRKMDTRAMANGPPYNQHRHLIQFPPGPIALEQCKMLHNRGMHHRIRHRPNSSLNMQAAASGGSGVSNGHLHSMNGIITNGNGHQSIGPSLGVHQQTPGQHIPGPGLSSTLSNYGGVPVGVPGGGGNHLYGLTGSHPTSPWMGGASNMQNVRQVQNLHGGSLGGNQSGPVSHFGNQAAGPAVALQSRGSSGNVSGHLMQGSWQAGGQNAHLLNSPMLTPRSLHHAMQLQSRPGEIPRVANHAAAMQPSVRNGVVEEPPRSPMLTPIRTAIAGEGSDEQQQPLPQAHSQKGRSIPPLIIPDVDIVGHEKGVHSALSPNDVSPCGSTVLARGETMPVSMQFCQSPKGKATTASSTHNGTGSNTGNGAFGNSSSASSTDVNGDHVGVNNQLDTTSSEKDAMGLDNMGMKDSVLDWESTQLDPGSPAVRMAEMGRELFEMDSLTFDSTHPIDTLEDYLNPRT